jgi:uncharacterized protein (TIGR03083 family)
MRTDNADPTTAAFLDAANAFAELVRRVEEHQWDAHGLGEWTVRSLVGHTGRAITLVSEYASADASTPEMLDALGYYQAALSGHGVHSSVAQRGRDAGVALGPDPAAAIGERIHQITALLADSQTRPQSFKTPMGNVRFDEYLRTRVLELVAHGDDLARAIGAGELPVQPNTRRIVLGLIADVAVARGDGALLTAALLGRAPLPAEYSMF